MSNRVIKIIVFVLLIVTISTYSCAITDGIKISNEIFSKNTKQNNISSKFDSEIKITNNNEEENNELKQSITELTKKATYLLLGEMNSDKESSENYYKRHKDYLKLRYNPEVPKDDSTFLGLDENSQEYKDDLLSGICVPGMFLKLKDLGIKYSSYGNIKISRVNEEMLISAITLEDVTMKERDEENKRYNTIKTNLTIYYYFKNLNSEYKLLYLYAETDDDIKEYTEKSEEKNGELSKNTDYINELKDLYNFSKANAITDEMLNKIYDENKLKIVYLSSMYNTGIVTTANGFFIKEGFILTTNNYIEKTLKKAQNIIISDSLKNVYELDGIVVMDSENDVAILKVKNKNEQYIQAKDNIKFEKEDAIITVNSKTGVGLTTTKGIIISVDKNIQTSLAITQEAQRKPCI